MSNDQIRANLAKLTRLRADATLTRIALLEAVLRGQTASDAVLRALGMRSRRERVREYRASHPQTPKAEIRKAVRGEIQYDAAVELELIALKIGHEIAPSPPADVIDLAAARARKRGLEAL